MITHTLTSRIPEIIATLPDEIEEALEAGAEAIADGAKQRVPVDEGTLRDAIHVERDEDLSYSVVAGNTEAFYGHIIEHGSTQLPARPFLLPAAEALRDIITKAVLERMGDA